MIWNYIRDFIVTNIFGGHDSIGVFYECFVGVDSNYGSVNTYDLTYSVGSDIDGANPIFISLGDWLSTTTTIIIMSLAVVLMCLLVRWVWRVVSSAMLLK